MGKQVVEIGNTKPLGPQNPTTNFFDFCFVYHAWGAGNW
jgi:hypothetical protein